MTDAKVYRAIARFINENKYSPSYQELCELTGIRSTATIFRAVQRLEEKGFIARIAKWGNRGILLAKAHPDCDVVEVRHGEWKEPYDGFHDKVEVVCSCCYRTGMKHFNYCPNCGASMLKIKPCPYCG